MHALDEPHLRVGFARDRHPFGPGEPLALGGIELPGPRLFGHSDGDVVLHAIAGALLAAGGLGDLGTLFPADARTPRGISSGALARDVTARVTSAGHAVAGVDVLIEAARPRLAARVDAMRAAIADALGIAITDVAISLSTGNLGGDAGAGRAIEATALATLQPVPREGAA